MEMFFYGALSNPPAEEEQHCLRSTAADSYHLPPPPPQYDHNFPSIPSEEVAELEWLSEFIDDTTSFPDFSSSSHTTSFLDHNSNNDKCKSATSNGEGGVRKCSHCASEKTPQWRTGPLGPKTLCNACGVRFKSGRLVPEYRPAASPTFVITQHSNSHRKVMELRRQKQL